MKFTCYLHAIYLNFILLTRKYNNLRTIFMEITYNLDDNYTKFSWYSQGVILNLHAIFTWNLNEITCYIYIKFALDLFDIYVLFQCCLHEIYIELTNNCIKFIYNSLRLNLDAIFTLHLNDVYMMFKCYLHAILMLFTWLFNTI